MDNHIDFFTEVYEKCSWGDNQEESYKGTSGGGSSIEYNNKIYIPFLKNLIQTLNIDSVIDLGCGDFRCGKLIYDDIDNIKYYGYDAYDKVIEHNKSNHTSDKYNFYHLDIFNRKEELIGGDLCILKDILQHWKLNEIYTFLDYLIENKKYKYILLVNCCNQQEDNPLNEERSTPLSIRFFPLKKYNPEFLFYYNHKEVSIIKIE